ncbi:MAG TPA: putative virulence factor [Candidatus Desulfovibrio intestinipullorum]|uniref:Virulence factor n=1 Tax=Candidatus Desulfovibrio intestinipullorum TaxID=2838536 RepID=A0A9D1PX76_9BACT|nr:putative virulence factor [Candidatus Desulfovibrio intestinipullorum]
MREKDKQLASQCQEWAKAARKAEQWLQDNRENVGGECELLCKNIRTAARAYGRLATAASRKMCVGVFGPSQAGKSYLISVLAKDTDGNLMADFAGTSVDFIRKINPEGGKESTGLVTRFTTTRPVGITQERPVRLRLFSEMDLVRIFANTYYADCEHTEAPDQEAILHALHDLEGLTEPSAVNSLTRDDVEDLREYLQKNFASRPRVQTLMHVYWTKTQELVSRLPLNDRVRLFGLIWDNVPEFDEYFLTLARALEDLGNPAEANCSLDALLPRAASIIDVARLSKSAPGSQDLVSLESLPDGHILSLPKSTVTAITAELTIFMPTEPDAFFAHTDLLDFPGYRSRLKTTNLRHTLQTEGELEHLFLRGKVAYLFERYCEEQELTSMLLCIGPENQEVQDLPGAINNWIGLTQGETPESRKGHEPTLFFILTKVDTQFARKMGTETAGADKAAQGQPGETNKPEDNANTWDIRLTNNLTNFFGAQYEWPDNWDGKPFRNVFLLRNPNFLCDAVFTFDQNYRETGIKMPEQVEKIHQEFLTSELVRRHFTNPEESWEAALGLNDGGISLLRKKLAPICNPDLKYNQTRDRALEISRKIQDRLQLYYRDDDINQRLEQKKKLAVSLMRTFAAVISQQQFADLLSRFLVSDFDLYEIASACEAIPQNSAQASQTPHTVVGSAINADDLLDDLFGDTLSAPAKSTPESEPEPEIENGTDQIAVFCQRAMEHWFEHVRTQAEQVTLQRAYKVPADFLNSLASELILSSRHAHLLEDMIAGIRAKSGFRNIVVEKSAWRMASEAAYRINSFVSWLGHDARLGQKTSIDYNGTWTTLFTPPALTFGPQGEPVVPEQQQQYDRAYYMDWLKAFYDCVISSLDVPEENFNPVQNSKLGAILDLFDEQHIS